MEIRCYASSVHVDRSTLPVATLVDDASRGHDGSVAELLQRFLPDLRAHVDRQVGPGLRLLESGADLVQSACREALASLQDGSFEFRGDEQFRAWLFQVALNKVRERARYHAAAHRRAVATADPCGTGLGNAADAAPSPSQLAGQREDQERLAAAFRLLSAEQQRIVQWAKVDNLSHREIAERLHTSEGNSRVLLARALARLGLLASRLSPTGGDPGGPPPTAL